jgi:L-ascorbate metabolism protein UlaG (beta-lactamase superfamily)
VALAYDSAAPPRRKRRLRRWIAVAAGLLLTLGAMLAMESGPLAAHPGPGSPALRQLPPAAWPADAITIAYLGHASLLMDYLGVRVISDPTFFKRVGLSVGGLFTIGPARLRPAPLAPAQLPHLDLILITHAHMDHLDEPSLAALPKDSTVVACSGCRDLIAPLGFRDVRTLRWHQSTTVDGLKITALGARHWGRRWPWQANRGYNSYLLEKNGVRMLLACDSAYTDIFASLHNHPPLIAAFSIGSYDPWIRHHANPEQAWAMFRETGARYMIPIHWGTFRLSKEPYGAPMARLLAAAGPLADRIPIRQIGAIFQADDPRSPIPETRTLPGNP